MVFPGMGFNPAFGGGTAVPAAIAFCASAVNTFPGASASFSGHNIGTASPDRYVAVATVGSDLGNAMTSVTVAGQACTRLVQCRDGAQSDTAVWITNAPVASGATATVVVNFAGSAGNVGIATYALTGLTANTATATDTEQVGGSSMSLAVQAGGVAIAVAGHGDATPGYTTTGVTEDVDQTVEAGQQSMCVGSLASATAQTLTITLNAAGSNNTYAACCVALR